MEFHQPSTQTIIISALLGITLITNLLSESALKHSAALEIIAICLGILFFAIVLFGLWLDEPWSPLAATILFALLAINTIALHFATKQLTNAALGIVLCTAGIVCTMLHTPARMTPLDSPVDLETYQIDEFNKDLAKIKATIKTAKKKARKKK